MSWYETCRTYYVCVDPIHVGAGGYRLGRVDNSIVREPGTRVPKVPGTSLSGAARSYAAMLCNRIDAAGQQTNSKGNRDYNKCPILYTFGTASDDVAKGQSKAGAVSFGDVRILFFPAHSTQGPLWVTTPELLSEAGLNFSGERPSDSGGIVMMKPGAPKEVDIGWLLFSDVKSGQWKGNEKHELAVIDRWKAIADRIVMVSPRFFGIIVNSNLEVRTSVSIDPMTGAAEEGLLFTYEAIPRTTWLFGDIVVDDYMFEHDGKKGFPDPKYWNPPPNTECEGWKKPMDVALSGLRLIQHLGIGGMGTRGFGRMALVASGPPQGGVL